VAGYFTEYSGMKFGLYLLGEWTEVVVIAGLVTALFLGGWAIPWVSDAALIGFLSGLIGPDWGNLLAMVVHVGVFMVKLVLMIFFQMLLRWSLPRFRYDQVMNLGWKIMLPLSLANILLTGLAILIVQEVVS
jgi:NADH-quinone oxidoreductase subunit H